MPGATLVASTGCEAIVEGSGSFVATVRLEFSAPATAGYAARRLTVDTLHELRSARGAGDRSVSVAGDCGGGCGRKHGGFDGVGERDRGKSARGLSPRRR